LHALGATADSGQHLAERCRGRVHVDGGSGHVREERMKDHVVLAVEEKNLALGTADFASECLCELYSGKASTDNDYSDWLHFFAPVARPDTTEDFRLLTGLLQLL